MIKAGLRSSYGGHPLVAALHLRPKPGDIAGNLVMAEAAVTEAKRVHPGLRWVVLPELFTTGYSELGGIHRHAEDAEEGTSARFFTSLARRLGVYVAYGFPEKRREVSGGVSDSANLAGPQGIVLTYRKRHLVRTTAEPHIFVPGTHLPVVRVGGARVALVICWDLGFPEAVREAALNGADLVLAPAGWRHPWGPQYDLVCAARALDNGVYLASANQLGDYPEARFDAPGGVYGPDGSRLARSTGAISVGDVDLGFPARWRAAFGSTLVDAPRMSRSHTVAGFVRP
jgi:predicted amidohydrolase